MNSTDPPVVSFVVPAHNEQDLLPRCLSAIRDAGQRGGEPFEIVVVNDASTDITPELARSDGARVVDVSLRRISAVRNAGASAARGRWLIFVDADTFVTRAVIRAALAALRRGEAGGGCAVRFDGGLPLWARVVAPVFTFVYRAVGLAAGCFSYCSREAFDRTGGFDGTMYAGEELRMSLALRRAGRFRVLAEHVITSGRKLRTHSLGEIFSVLRLAIGGPAAMQDGTRPEFGLWYGPRRREPR